MSTTEQSAHLRACPACGSTRFVVTENYSHIGDLSDDGVLTYHSWPDGGGRERIACASCEREIPESDFVAVEYS